MTIKHVVIGIVFNAHQQVLVAERPLGKPYAGYWEFPGGKVETGETAQQALARELWEEVDITIDPLVITPLIQVRQTLPEDIFWLDTWIIKQFQGQPKPKENQQLRWVALDALTQLQFPPANEMIIERLLAEFCAAP